MALVKTELEPSHLQRNADDFAVVRSIAESGSDGPVLMLNMNRYSLKSGFPDRGVYQQYISGLGNFLEGAGAKLLWRFPVLGQAVGDEKIHEIIACWYPVRKIFLDLYKDGRCGKLPFEGSVRGICCHPSMSRRATSVCAKWNRRRSSEHIVTLNVRIYAQKRTSIGRVCLLSAKSGHSTIYSITLSARASSCGGTVRPSAVLRLIKLKVRGLHDRPN